MANLKKIKGAEAHATYIVTGSDKRMLQALQVNLTCEDEFLEKA